MRHIICGIIFLWCIVFSGCALHHEKLYLVSQSVMPNTERMMKTAGFWISRHPEPDARIMSEMQISLFNAKIQSEKHLTTDIFNAAVTTTTLASLFDSALTALGKGIFYRKDGKRASKAFFEMMRKQMNIEIISSTNMVRYGIIVHYADQRILPTNESLFTERNDIDFDILQNNGLDVGTPVAILHVSKDEKWLYTVSALSNGWISRDHIAFCSSETLKQFMSRSKFVVTTAPKADIFLDDKMIQQYDYVRMGSRLPFIEQTADKVHVAVPVRNDDGFLLLRRGVMRKHDIHQGYLPYTARTILTQAFEHLNTPYGWGDMYGEQDCSRFIQQVFATVGIMLPRNSLAQAKVGTMIAAFSSTENTLERIQALNTVTGGNTILYLNGHIMLFLGIVNEKPYAIHALWGYQQHMHLRDHIRVVNRIVVSDLSLGAGTRKKSLLERVIKIQCFQ